MSVAEQMPLPFCVDKQENDRLLRAGKPIKMKTPVALDGEDEPFRDLFKERIDDLQKVRKDEVRIKEKKLKDKLFRESVLSIPDVKYNPNTALQLMRSSDGGKLFATAVKSRSSKAFTTSRLELKHSAEQEYMTG
jgi:hypothetical protein